MLFYFACAACNKTVRKLLHHEQKDEPQKCPDCKGDLKRRPMGPTSQVTEVLDNGIMPKKVERYADAEELYKERAAKSDENSGK